MNSHNPGEAMETKYLLRRFVPYFRPYLFVFFFDLFCASMTTVSDIILPMIIRSITNTLQMDPESFTVSLIRGCLGQLLHAEYWPRHGCDHREGYAPRPL